jgi:hypothetical protein
MFGPLSAKLTFIAAAPVSSTWAAFTQVRRWPQVLPDIAKARIEPKGPLAVGAVIRTIARPDRNIIDMTYQVTAAEPERLLAIQSEAEGYRAETQYEFSATHDTENNPATEVTATTTIFASQWRGRIVSMLWRRKIMEQVERAMRRRTGSLIELAEKIAAEHAPPHA